jgi:DNA-directed DNA polymerase III PolC
MSPFTPIRVRSHGSLLAGVASPEALCERAAELGYAALGLTDRDNLYLAVRFLKAARGAGLAPVVGAEVSAPPSALHGPARADGVRGRPPARALLVPLDRRGWANLCAVLTARHLDDAFDLVRGLAAHHAGLHVIVESPALAAALLAAGVPPAVSAADELASGLPRAGGLWLGVRGIAAERRGLRDRLAASWTLGVPAVATADVWMLEPRDHETHRAAVTAAAGELLERMPAGAFCAREAWLAAPAEWVRRVRGTCGGAGVSEQAEILLENNAALAARCRLELEMGVPVFPRATLPPGVSGAARLRRLALEGLHRRYPAAGPARGADGAVVRAPARIRTEARARLDSELALIERMGFTDYFLLVADIVGFARGRGIPTVGRGSGASSIVSYVLGVTSVDPVRHGLCFERFLHPQRRDCPDLDVDLCWKRRDEVIAHVYEAYGHDRVAMISTHATLGPRSAFREAAKALGVPLPRVNALARRVPRQLDASALERVLETGAPGVPPARVDVRGGRGDDATERARAAGAGPGAGPGLGPHDFGPEFSEPRIAEALRLAARMAGAPRHLSVHCGGLVIADRELTHYLPLERAAKGVVVSQFEMRAVEAVGLVKMDLLGNRAITTIGECVNLAGGAPDPEAFPDDDPVAAAAIAAGDTLNCFQLESPAMRNLLRMLEASTLDDTVAAVALVRPGPAESGMKEAFCRRRRGLEPVWFPHERLRATLAETQGILLYEEDVMRVTSALCGLPLAEGETLRRAIAASRSDGEFRFLERGFVAQAVRAGVSEADAHAVWRELARFAAYAFCKAHAAGYGRLAWQSAALKCRHPAEWAAGVLNHHAGMYPTWVHVEDLRRGGIHRPPVTFLAPCVERSAWDTTLEPVAADGRPGSTRPVRVGLHRVAGLARATGERIVAARPFASLADLADRVRPTPPELDALVLAGALDGLAGHAADAAAAERTRAAGASGTPVPRTRASMRLEARVLESLAHAVPARVRHATNPRRGGLALPDGEPLAPTAGAPRPGGDTLPELPELPLADLVRGEFAATGLWFSAHPLDVLVPRDALDGCVRAADLERHAGGRVRVCGIPCAARRVEAKTGGSVLFTTLADHAGLVECVLFPDRYRRWGAHMRGEVVRAEGRVDETLGALTVVVDRAEPLGARDRAAAPLGWQDAGPPSRNRVA